MANPGGISASLQGRYASALFDLASENGQVSAVESDLEMLDQALDESPELAGLIRNPQISRGDAGTALEAVAKILALSPSAWPSFSRSDSTAETFPFSLARSNSADA